MLWQPSMRVIEFLPSTSRAGQAAGGSFKTYRMGVRRPTSQCDAQTEFFVWTRLQPFHGGDVVTCFDVVGCGVR